MLARLYRRQQRRDKRPRLLSPLEAKLRDLAAQRREVLAEALAIVNNPGRLDARDRTRFEELESLAEEIKTDYLPRYTRGTKEKWRILCQRKNDLF